MNGLNYQNRGSMIEHEIGDSVYLRTDPEQLERLVTAIVIRETGVLYSLAQASNESYHHAFEISINKDILKVI